MASTIITRSCGHQEEIKLYGKHSERAKREAWEATRPCRACWVQAREASPEPPKVLVQSLSAHDPVARANHYRAAAIREHITLDSLDAAPEASGYASHRAATLRRIAELEAQARNAANTPARRAAVELVCLNSYPVREALSARGWRFDRDAHSLDLLGRKTAAGWIIQFEETERARAELAWIAEQEWAVQGASPADQLVEALAAGRPELLVHGREDSVEAAMADREAARIAREERRRAREASKPDLSHLRTLVIDRPAVLVAPEERSDKMPYDWRARARDGRIVHGWILDGEWIASVVVAPSGSSSQIPTTADDWPQRLGRMAQATIK